MEGLFITKRLHVYVYCINTCTVRLDNKYQTINMSPTGWWTEWQDMEREEHLNYSGHAAIISLISFKNSQKGSPVTPDLTPLILLPFIFNLQTYVYFIMPPTK